MPRSSAPLQQSRDRWLDLEFRICGRDVPDANASVSCEWELEACGYARLEMAHSRGAVPSSLVWNPFNGESLFLDT